MAGRAGTGQKCHLKVPGATTRDKTASSNALFLTCFSPPSNELHVHLFLLSAQIVKKPFAQFCRPTPPHWVQFQPSLIHYWVPFLREAGGRESQYGCQFHGYSVCSSWLHSGFTQPSHPSTPPCSQCWLRLLFPARQGQVGLEDQKKRSESKHTYWYLQGCSNHCPDNTNETLCASKEIWRSWCETIFIIDFIPTNVS